MREIDDLIRRHHEMGALSTGEHGFYERLGWERWRGPTFVRRDGATVRTPDEDDGIMVLRFGPTAAVDLGAALSCEARPGDDW
jgi:aminoglycoside 2'-N-acetyltransferase I